MNHELKKHFPFDSLALKLTSAIKIDFLDTNYQTEVTVIALSWNTHLSIKKADVISIIIITG